MPIPNLNNSSEVIVFGTIDAGNDGHLILLQMLKAHDPRNYILSDFVFSTPVALTGQETVVDIITDPSTGLKTAIIRNTRIFLTPKAGSGMYGPKIVYYDRIHASDLLAITVTKGTSTSIYDILTKVNIKTGLGIKQEDVQDGPLPAADSTGLITVTFDFKPTSVVFYGTAKINAIDYQFGGNAANIAAGTLFGAYCYGTNLMHVVADGLGGAQIVLFEANSATCPLPTAGIDGRPGLDGTLIVSQFSQTPQTIGLGFKQYLVDAAFTHGFIGTIFSINGQLTTGETLDAPVMYGNMVGLNPNSDLAVGGWLVDIVINKIVQHAGEVMRSSRIDVSSLPGQDGPIGNTGSAGKILLPPIACSDEFTALTVGDNVVTFHWTIDQAYTSVWAGLTTPQQTGAVFTVDVYLEGNSIFSTPITIDNNHQTSLTASIPSILNTNFIQRGKQVSIMVTQVGDGTATGLKVYWVTDENFSTAVATSIVLEAGQSKSFGMIYSFDQFNDTTTSGSYYLGGVLLAGVMDSVGNSILIGNGTGDTIDSPHDYAQIIKINPQGDILYESSYRVNDATLNAYAELVTVDSLDNSYIFFDTILPLLPDSTDYTSAIGFLKLDPDGVILDQKIIYTADFTSVIFQTRALSDGILLTHGGIGSFTTSDGVFHTGLGNVRPINTLCKLGFDGTVLWAVHHETDNYTPAFDVGPDGSIYAVYTTAVYTDQNCIMVEKYAPDGTSRWTYSISATDPINISTTVGGIAVTPYGIYMIAPNESKLFHLDVDGNLLSVRNVLIPDEELNAYMYFWAIRAEGNLVYISGTIDGTPNGPSCAASIICIDSATDTIIRSAALRIPGRNAIYNFGYNSSAGSLDLRDGMLLLTGFIDNYTGVAFKLYQDFTDYIGARQDLYDYTDTVTGQYAIDPLTCTFFDITGNYYPNPEVVTPTVTTTITVDTLLDGAIIENMQFSNSGIFPLPFNFKVIGTVNSKLVVSDRLLLAGMDVAKELLNFKKASPAPLVAVMNHPDSNTLTLDSQTTAYLATTIAPSAQVEWVSYNNRFRFTVHGLYRITLTCRVACRPNEVGWNGDKPVVLGSAIQQDIQTSGLIPPFMDRSAHVRTNLSLARDPSLYEQWTDEYLVNYNFNTSNTFYPLVYASTATSDLSQTLADFNLIVTVVRIGNAI